MNRAFSIADLRFSIVAANLVCGPRQVLRQVSRRRQAGIVLAAGLSLSLLTTRVVQAQGQTTQPAAASPQTANKSAGNNNAAAGNSNTGAAQHTAPAAPKPASAASASSNPVPAKPAPAPAAVPTVTNAANKPALPTTQAASPTTQAANNAQSATGAAGANTAPPQNTAQASHISASAPVPLTAPTSPAPTKPANAANAATQQPAPTAPAPAPLAAKMSPNDPLAQTKPDIFTPADVNSLPPGSLKTGDHTQSNAFAPVAGAWKMLAYLLPMLLVIVVCLQLLKRFQTRMGRLPGGLGVAPALNNLGRNSGSRWNAASAAPPSKGLLHTLLSGMAANKTRHTPGSSIRVLESAPVGGASVHLLEVRGRVLLLGGSATGLTLLTEFGEHSGTASSDFRDLLTQAASDMDAIDYEQPDMPAAATVSALEDLMRETNQAVSRRARRFHTVQEAEGQDE